MKTLFLLFGLGLALFGQTPTTVTVSITVKAVDGTQQQFTSDLKPAVIQALAAFLADVATKNPDGTTTPKYAGGIPELLVRHVLESLAYPLVQRYKTAPEVQTAADAAAAASQEVTAAVVQAATAPVVVK